MPSAQRVANRAAAAAHGDRAPSTFDAASPAAYQNTTRHTTGLYHNGVTRRPPRGEYQLSLCLHGGCGLRRRLPGACQQPKHPHLYVLRRHPSCWWRFSSTSLSGIGSISRLPPPSASCRRPRWWKPPSSSPAAKGHGPSGTRSVCRESSAGDCARVPSMLPSRATPIASMARPASGRAAFWRCLGLCLGHSHRGALVIQGPGLCPDEYPRAAVPESTYRLRKSPRSHTAQTADPS